MSVFKISSYDFLNSLDICSDVTFSALILTFGSSLSFFLVNLAKNFSIWFIFPRNQFFVSLGNFNYFFCIYLLIHMWLYEYMCGYQRSTCGSSLIFFYLYILLIYLLILLTNKFPLPSSTPSLSPHLLSAPPPPPHLLLLCYSEKGRLPIDTTTTWHIKLN